MSEEQQKLDPNEASIQKRLMPYRFWLYLVLSAFLTVTFVYYLPLRFQSQGLEHMMEERGDLHEQVEGTMVHEDGAIYHEESEVREGLAVNLNVTPVPVKIGAPTKFDFFVNEKPGNVQVPASDLQIEHEKLMHVIGVRNDMNEFFHIHPLLNFASQNLGGQALSSQVFGQPLADAALPQPKNLGGQALSQEGLFSTDYTFAKPGLYKIWSEIKKDNVVHSFGHPELAVQGQGPTFEKQVSFGRNAIAGSYQVSLKANEPIVKGHEHELSFDIHAITGDEVEVEPYLGADMHLTIIKDDWKQFIHTHPENHDGNHQTDKDGSHLFAQQAKAHGNEEIPGAMHKGEGMLDDKNINFHVVFPEAGLYKAFAQFRPKGTNLPPDEALIVSFWLQVSEKSQTKVPVKVLLTGISLILIAILSSVVKRYITIQREAK